MLSDPGRVPRSRLTEAVASSRLVVLRAPSGFGKTALLAELGDEASTRVALTAEQPSRSAFWSAVVAAAGGDGESVQEDVDAGRIASLLAERSTGRLLIDGADHCTEAAQVARDLLAVMELLPGLSAVVASRIRSPLEDAAGTVGTTVLTAEDLRFTESEIAALAERLDVAIGDDVLAQVAALTDGVPLLLRIVLQSLQRLGPLDSLPAGLNDRVSDVLDRILFDGEDEATVDALLSLAPADALDEALATDLVGLGGPAALAEAERRGLGDRSVHVSGEGDEAALHDVFRFTSAVRSALRRRARSTVPDRYLEGRRRALRWAVDHDFPVFALETAADLREHETASWIIVDRWSVFSIAARGTIARVYGKENRRTLLEHPIVAAALALAHFAQRDQQWKAREYFGLALLGIATRRRAAPPAERYLFLVVEFLATRLVGDDGKRVRVLGARLLERFAELTPDDQQRLRHVVPTLVNQIAASLLFSGDTAGALQALASGSTRAALLSPTRRVRYAALSLRAGASAIAGELASARESLAASERLGVPDEIRTGYAGSPARLAEAWLHLEDLDPEAALAALRPVHPHYDTIENVHLLAAAESWAHILLGRPAMALELVVDVRSRVARQRPLSAVVQESFACATSFAALSAGDLELAESAAKDAGRTAAGALARARVVLAQGRPERALAALASVGPAESLTVRQRAARHLLLAAIDAERGDRGARLEAERAEALLRLHGMRLPLIELGRHGRDALRPLMETMPVEGDPALGPQHRPTPQLTPRERAVLAALAQSAGYREVAAALGVSLGTVQRQVNSAYRKLGVTNRADALRVARVHHLLPEE
ncbi:LuxR C-terminal-related transcriptional regulator [Rathayibacter sp. Leaf296]|uniref:LuxR C-terminal-related transcriptional regulator n=1 Tax=Rathayibacter sp. Leaf296 TaxID=1736327 RepID=UPI0007028ECC|nr:LuxR C-terminal-related transcriptional regulator [Rathayibacter sp. Leaf296]KQQ09651.1 hypothetical protein ASF46_00485 [Rathayibacter sp. Leaf296]